MSSIIPTGYGFPKQTELSWCLLSSGVNITQRGSSTSSYATHETQGDAISPLQGENTPRYVDLQFNKRGLYLISKPYFTDSAGSKIMYLLRAGESGVGAPIQHISASGSSNMLCLRVFEKGDRVYFVTGGAVSTPAYDSIAAVLLAPME